MSPSLSHLLANQEENEMTGSYRFEYIRIEQGSRPIPWSEPAQWVPLIDVYGTEQAVVLEILLAGICPEDTQIDLNHDHIRISGARRDIDVSGRGEFYHVEIPRGHFHRVIALPKGTDVNKANVDFELGVLKIVVPWSGQPWASACRTVRFPEEWS